jgi:Flp pilus assembly protein CpaB
MRGFTIPVTQTKSPVALRAPGDFVDILATFEVKGTGSAAPPAALPNLPFVPWFGDSADPRGAITLLQNVQVLAVQRAQVEGLPYDPSVRGTPPKDGNVTYLTLAVTPEEAQMLALAVERSRTITVSLRPFGDTETQELTPFVEPVRLPASADANAGAPAPNPGAPAAPPAPRP